MPDAPRLTLILGGARSGKSRHAEALIETHPPPWRYIATAEALDAEMTDRIARHRARRPAGWITAEAALDLAAALTDVPAGQPVLIDCLTLWLSNLMRADRDLDAETTRLVAAIATRRGHRIVVSNEVGLGIVPENALARRFRDAAGRLNQAIAARADDVLLMVAGLAMRVK